MHSNLLSTRKVTSQTAYCQLLTCRDRCFFASTLTPSSSSYPSLQFGALHATVSRSSFAMSLNGKGFSEQFSPRRVLVLGSGAREHALVRALAASPHRPLLFVAPGHDALRADTSHLFACLDAPAQHDLLCELCLAHQIDLVVVGPEVPLSQGVVDTLQLANIPVIGPTQSAARLESSKLFAKHYLHIADAPCAPWQELPPSFDEAVAQLSSGDISFPCMLKADGLASGKGSFLVRDLAHARDILHDLLVARTLGEAGARVLVEQLLHGTELSYIVLTDGEHVVPFSTSQDYKRLRAESDAPNTGGMGAISPAPECTPEIEAVILDEILRPLLRALREDGIVYRGFLYLGLMLTDEGPKVLEINVRLGDPEAQVLLGVPGSPDLLDALCALVTGSLGEWGEGHLRHEEHVVCVVSASEGYPSLATRGTLIPALRDEHLNDRDIFGAGLCRDDEADVWRTCGGRVLSVRGRASTREEARRLAYALSDRFDWDGRQRREDIGEE